MGITKVDTLSVGQSRAYLTASLPSSPDTYYGTGIGDTDSREWRGGELLYHTGDNRFYIQTATSGTTATWKRLLEATVSV